MLLSLLQEVSRIQTFPMNKAHVFYKTWLKTTIIFPCSFWFLSIFYFYGLTSERKGKGDKGRERDKMGERERHDEGEREGEVCCSIYLYRYIGWFLYVPFQGIQSAILAYWDKALTVLGQSWFLSILKIRFLQVSQVCDTQRSEYQISVI